MRCFYSAIWLRIGEKKTHMEILLLTVHGSQGAELAGAQHPAAWRASPLFDAAEADLCARQRGLQLLIGDGFLVPELKGEASEDEQADSSSENNVGNVALFVIGLHRSGGAIAHFPQDWEVANVALSCQKAFDMLCQELFEVERKRGWFGF